MPAAAIKTTEVIAQNELEAARTLYISLRQQRRDYVKEHEQVRLSRDLASMPNLNSYSVRAAASIAKAGAELQLAKRNPRRTAARLEELENKIAELDPEFQAAKEHFETLCSLEAEVLSAEMLPKHQAAVSRISKALQELSASLAEEIEVRDEFLKRAPAPGMSCPWPNFSSLLLPTCWMPSWNSRASVWHREAAAKGYLQETKAPAK